MKLLAITGYYKPAYVYGGPVRSESALYEGLAQRGVEITVVTTNANGGGKLDVPLFTPVDVNGVQVIYCKTKSVPGSPLHSPKQMEVAKQLIQQVDLVNLQTFWGYATLPLSRYCISHQIPYYVSLRGQLMDYAMRQTKWTKRLKKQVFLHLMGYQYLNGAAALHCTSPLEVSQLQAFLIHRPIFVVPNSIDVSAFQELPARGRLRAKYQIPEDALVMVMIGRLDTVKSPHLAVSALIAAQELSAPAHPLIVGPDVGGFQSSLEAQARQAGCAERLHFTGLLQKEDLLQAMADSDLLIMPSQSENFGMSAAEGMAAGLPILVSDNVPVGTWAKQACAGETAACDSGRFSQAAVSMLSDPDRLKVMGKNGKAAATKLFSQDAVAEEMQAHLERIVEQASRHAI